LGKCWQRLAAEHVTKDTFKAANAETAPQTEVRQTKDDKHQRKSNGAGKLSNVNGIPVRNLFGLFHWTRLERV